MGRSEGGDEPAHRRGPRGPRRWTKRVAAALLGLILGFAAVEALVRFGPWSVPEAVVATLDTGGRGLYAPHPSLRYSLLPEQRIEQRCSDYGLFEVATGSLGDPAIGFRLGGYEGPADGVVLGDSFAMGAGVDEEHTLVARLAERLDLSLLNLGVAGYGPQQANRVLADYALPLEPEYVFWVFFGNDLVDAVRFSRWDAKGRRTSGDGPESDGLHKRYWATYKLYRYFTPFISDRREHWQGENGVEYVFTYDLDEELDLRSTDVARGVELVREELRTLKHRADGHGFRPVLVLVPFKEQTYEAEFRAVASRRIRADDLHAVYRTVEAAARELAIPTLDLTSALRARRDEQLYLVVDPHLSERGNELAAEAVAAFVRADSQ